ncbi:MAG: methyltransferase domain-containing protein [Prochlorococcus marinus XMU1428]|nr:methyltransferase domain-containing protein [Prochlorococcus marinus XMU1428]
MQENNFVKIKNCRLCKSEKLTPFIDFGKVSLGNDLQENKKKALESEKYPLVINKCNFCDHFQLGVSVNPQKLYATNYTYLSGIGNSFVKHLENYANWAFNEFQLSSENLVLDIGSNDGTCLKFFKNLGCRVLGIDPAKIPSDIANKNKIPTINEFFSSSLVDKILIEYGQVDFITSHNVLAHIEDIDLVFKNIYKLLKINSYFVFEIGYFPSVLKTGCFDTTYHEHLDYHHAKPLASFLTSIGFEVVDFIENKVQGGSLRTIVKKSQNPNLSISAMRFLENESRSIITNTEFLNSWNSNIKDSMKSFEQKVKKLVNSGLKGAGYGVPTKATLILELGKLSQHFIPFIVEDNNNKIGRFLPSTGIPIFPVSEINVQKPDFIVIFAWNFADDIIEKLSRIVTWKCRFIIPLPEYKEVSF